MFCPKCDSEMKKVETCADSWNPVSDKHTTREGFVLVCPNCKYEIDEGDIDG